MNRLAHVPEVRVGLWGGLLNAGWELLQSPLYADWGRGPWHLVWTRMHCTGGDVLVLLGAFWVTALAFRTRRWVTERGFRAAALFVFAGLGYTVFSETLNIRLLHSWAYAPSMPTAFGIGLGPLLQWVFVPGGVLLLARRSVRHAARAAEDRKGKEGTGGDGQQAEQADARRSHSS